MEFNNSWTNNLSKIEEEMNDESNNEADLNICQDVSVDNEHNTEMKMRSLMKRFMIDSSMVCSWIHVAAKWNIAQEVLDQHFDGIMSLAPAEGNNPVKLVNG